MNNRTNVKVYMLAKRKVMEIDPIKYPNLWLMVFNMSTKYYSKSFA